MAISGRARAVASGWAVLAAASALVIACSTTNGGNGENDPSLPPDRTAATGDPTARPGFDASFADDDAAAADAASGDAPVCSDPDDQGGAPNVAKALPNTDDCNNSTRAASGVVNGAVDVDYFKFVAADKTGCSIDLSFGSQTPGLELCMWASCFTGATTLNGCGAGTRTKNPQTNEDGCCIKTPGSMVPDYDCPGLSDDDSATFFVRVRSAGPNQCMPYRWTYTY